MRTGKTRMRQLSGITLAISPRVRIADRLFMSSSNFNNLLLLVPVIEEFSDLDFFRYCTIAVLT